MPDYFGTGPITTRPKTLFKHFDNSAKVVSLVNGSGAEMVPGMEVYLSNDGEVTYRTTGTQVPIGIITVGGATAGEMVTVQIYGKGWVTAIAKGGTLAEGDLVRQDGTTSTNGLPGYVVVATAGHWVTGIVVFGNTIGLECQVMVLDTPIKF